MFKKDYKALVLTFLVTLFFLNISSSFAATNSVLNLKLKNQSFVNGLKNTNSGLEFLILMFDDEDEDDCSFSDKHKLNKLVNIVLFNDSYSVFISKLKTLPPPVSEHNFLKHRFKSFCSFRI